MTAPLLAAEQTFTEHAAPLIIEADPAKRRNGRVGGAWNVTTLIYALKGGMVAVGRLTSCHTLAPTAPPRAGCRWRTVTGTTKESACLFCAPLVSRSWSLLW